MPFNFSISLTRDEISYPPFKVNTFSYIHLQMHFLRQGGWSCIMPHCKPLRGNQLVQVVEGTVLYLCILYCTVLFLYWKFSTCKIAAAIQESSAYGKPDQTLHTRIITHHNNMVHTSQ